MTHPPRISSAEHATPAGLNWAGNYRYAAPILQRPRDVAEVQEIVRSFTRVKALGSRHSFNDIADSPAAQVSTENLNAEVAIDPEAMTATVESGLRYGHFCSFLDDRGYALHNLASLPHISVAGACSTATHGSGINNGNLATAVTEIEFVDGTGEIVMLNRETDADVFNGAVVGLGAFGIVTRLKLKIEKRFAIAQNVFENLAVEAVEHDFDAIMSAACSVSMFTTFRTKGVIDQVWLKRRTGVDLEPLDAEFYGAKAATENLHPIREMLAANCTEQLGEPGQWYDRLPHFKMGYTPSSGEELQSEYFVARSDAADALRAILRIGDEIRPYVFTSEIRTIAADDLWLSPSYHRDSAAFHFTWRQDPAVLEKVVPLVERELAPFDIRPHWGKLFTIEPAKIRGSYEHFDDFVKLLDRFDPSGKFRNGFLDRLVAG